MNKKLSDKEKRGVMCLKVDTEILSEDTNNLDSLVDIALKRIRQPEICDVEVHGSALYLPVF